MNNKIREALFNMLIQSILEETIFDTAAPIVLPCKENKETVIWPFSAN